MAPAPKLSVLVVFCSLLSGCAQTGAPLPPSLELPKPPTDLRASRKGNRVTLTWTEPTHTTDRQSVRYFGATRICRTTDAEMKECGIPIAQLTPPARSSSQPKPQPLQSFVDTLSSALQEQSPTGEISYAVEVPNRDGRSAGLSNRITIALAPVLPPPASFAAQVTGQGIALTWDGTGETQPAPEIQHIYRVYRREGESAKDVLIAEIPLRETGPVRYVDPTIEWEKTYVYRADVTTLVNLGFHPCPNAKPSGPDCAEIREVEGDDAPEIKVVAHDTFPPAVPAGLQAVYSGEGQQPFIDLIWAPVTDADLAGYNVFRHETGTDPVKLNTDLVKSPSYRDKTVRSGRTYIYSISSVDLRNNESARSEEASETAP